jgi:hypothetical protein
MSQNQTIEVLESHGFDTALRFHLTSRLFPPMGDGFELAKLAIEACDEGEPGRLVDDGVSRRGPAGDIVSAWRLEAFIEDEDELALL